MRVVVLQGDGTTFLPVVAPLDVIAANIISSVLEEMLPAFKPALAEDGVAVLGGILTEELPGFQQVLQRLGWTVNGQTLEQSWCALTVKPVR
jgi:ribosomal protein L11 methyltransferase